MRPNLILILIGVSLVIMLGWFFVQAKNNKTNQATASPTPVSAFEARWDEQGEVTVVVTPFNLSSPAEAWSFEVQFDTHSVELNEDLVTAAWLKSDGQAPRPALSWQGDGPGGHHRQGRLLFAPISPRPTQISLELKNIGGISQRVFTWQLIK